MSKHCLRCTALSVLTGLVFTGLALGDGIDVKLTPSGYASFGLGQIVRSGGADNYLQDYTGTPQTNHLLIQEIFTGFNLETSFNPLPITANFGIEMKTFDQTPRDISDKDYGVSQRLTYFPYLTRADFTYSCGKMFNIDAGYFPFKYNADSRNLGEYLFRTGTYPQYIITNFDFPMARLAGLLVNGSPFEGLTWDAILNMNTDWNTLGNLNFTAIASYKPVKAFEFGAGVQFANFLVANSGLTHPMQPSLADGGDPADMYLSSPGDTETYTFAGTKIMARLSFDPKEVLPWEAQRVFGENDLKIYSEAAILGVKNYPASIGKNSADITSTGPNSYDTLPTTDYSDLWKRVPVMVGFNFPTFKLLDVLSVEGEWFGSDHPNSTDAYSSLGTPDGSVFVGNAGGTSNYPYADSAKDHWKWSVYARKTIKGHFSVTGQIASDHYRWELNDY